MFNRFDDDEQGQLTGYPNILNDTGYILEVIVSPNAKPIIKKLSSSEMTPYEEIVVSLTQRVMEEVSETIDEASYDEGNILLAHYKDVNLGAMVVTDFPNLQCVILSNVETLMVENVANSRNTSGNQGRTSLDLGWVVIDISNKPFNHLGRYNFRSN